MVPGDEFAHPSLMGIVGIGVQQADGDAAHALPGQRAGGLQQPLLVERLQLLSVVGHAALDLAHQVEGDEPGRLHPEEGIAVTVGHRLARDLDDVAEALGHDQPEAVELVLQDGVGRGGRAVQEARDGALPLARRLHRLANAVEQADAGVGWRARRLQRKAPPVRLVDGDHVGERAAGVDRNPQPHALLRPSAAGCGAPRRRIAVIPTRSGWW